MCSKTTIFFFPQQTLTFRQIRINLHFQDQHLTSQTPNQLRLDNDKVERPLIHKWQRHFVEAILPKMAAFIYNNCIICNNKIATTCRTCGSRKSDAKAITSNCVLLWCCTKQIQRQSQIQLRQMRKRNGNSLHLIPHIFPLHYKVYLESDGHQF